MGCCKTSNVRHLLAGCLLALMLATGVGEALAAESGDFSGLWVANGTRQLFPFEESRQIYTFKLSGHVNLQTAIGGRKDFWSQCVGLADSLTGSMTRCVWRDLHGAKIFITLQSEGMAEDRQVVGTIIGGTRHLKGIEGELSFVWSDVSFQKEANRSTIAGQALGLNGSYRIP